MSHSILYGVKHKISLVEFQPPSHALKSHRTDMCSTPVFGFQPFRVAGILTYHILGTVLLMFMCSNILGVAGDPPQHKLDGPSCKEAPTTSFRFLYTSEYSDGSSSSSTKSPRLASEFPFLTSHRQDSEEEGEEGDEEEDEDVPQSAAATSPRYEYVVTRVEVTPVPSHSSATLHLESQPSSERDDASKRNSKIHATDNIAERSASSSTLSQPNGIQIDHVTWNDEQACVACRLFGLLLYTEMERRSPNLKHSWADQKKFLKREERTAEILEGAAQACVHDYIRVRDLTTHRLVYLPAKHVFTEKSSRMASFTVPIHRRMSDFVWNDIIDRYEPLLEQLVQRHPMMCSGQEVVSTICHTWSNICPRKDAPAPNTNARHAQPHATRTKNNKTTTTTPQKPQPKGGEVSQPVRRDGRNGKVVRRPHSASRSGQMQGEEAPTQRHQDQELDVDEV